MSDKGKKISTLSRVLQSVFASMFGVQSQQNMEKDFKQLDPLPYIFTGIVVVIAFILILYFVVQSVIGQ